MAERGIHVDHSTVHRWVVHFSPLLLERFNRRKRPVTGKWHVDETYVRVRGRWIDGSQTNHEAIGSCDLTIACGIDRDEH